MYIAIGAGDNPAALADFTKHYDYEYPDGLDLRPGKDFHKELITKILKRAREAHGAISNRFPAWKEIDHTLTTYIDLTESEKGIKDKDHRKPVSIVFPYTHAILETMLGYLMSAFIQDPIIRYEGTSPEDTIGAILMEYIIEKHNRYFKTPLTLHTLFRDDLTYGFGVAAPRWTTEWGFKTVVREVKHIFSQNESFRDVEEAILFEGNELVNIDPYLCLPDPQVPIHEIQKMEYFGWLDRVGLMDLLDNEKHDDDIFNVRYLKELKTRTSSIYPSDQSGRNTKTKTSTTEKMYSSPVDLIRMYIKLIPKDWNLGDSEYPEKWLFTVAGDNIILEARPLGLDHDKFPLIACASEFDGYSAHPISRLESLFGLQETVDWLFNSHVANVRKAIQDMWVYDPYIINTADLKDPKPGKMIRTRRPVWGKGVKDSIMQFPVNDVTRQHVGDVSWIMDYMQKIAGTGEMGAQRKGGPERLTGTEYQGTQREIYSRLERVARIIGIQAIQDMGMLYASHTQQFMSEETYIKTTGRWQEVLMSEYGQSLEGKMKVSPKDIMVNYDLDPRDGTVPGNNFSDVWVRMFEIISKTPELQKEFSVVRIFKHIARNSGAKNVEEFVKIKTMDNQQIDAQVQQGNMVPSTI